MTSQNESKGSALAVVEGHHLAVPDIRDVEHSLDAVDAFKKAVHTRLIENVDYGTIPGTPKPTLYQPGAQKVCELMKLRPRFEAVRIIEDWDRPLFQYAYRCVLVHIPSGYEVSECIGSCNSMEAKYRWRYTDRRCPSCTEETIRKSNPQYGDGWYCNRRAGGCGANFDRYDPAIAEQQSGKVPNDDIFSQLNTLDKMAQKRGLVGASLFIGRLSDVFTQDLEDMDIRSIPMDERAQELAQSQTQQHSSANGARSGGNGASPNGNAKVEPPPKGTKCSVHDKVWALHPKDGVPAHPDGPGNWCYYDPEVHTSAPSGNGQGSPLDRLGERLRTEGVPWPQMLAFLGVETWTDYSVRFADDDLTDREQEKVATLAAWERYEEDLRYRATGCKKCGGKADVLGQLWCSTCIAEKEADDAASDDQPMFDAEGNVVNRPPAPDPAIQDAEVDAAYTGEDGDALPF